MPKNIALGTAVTILVACLPGPPAADWLTTETTSSETTGTTQDTTSNPPTGSTGPTGSSSGSSSSDTPGVCGDGTVDVGEECDDGNVDDNDDCLACKSAACGDGVIQAGVDECDDGNTVDTDDCTNECKLATCGDGIVGPQEECDDGNGDDTDDCPKCKKATCGDGFVWADKEQCDDGNMDNTDACLTECKVATCGDKYVYAGVEECDDGDSDDPDSCNNCFAPRIIFISSSSMNGNITGLIAADTVCTNLANASDIAAVKFKAWHAWLSDKNGSPADADGIAGFKGRYITPSGTHITTGVEGLTSGAPLSASISVNEHGVAISGAFAWTGTRWDGSIAVVDPKDPMTKDLHCAGWTSASDQTKGLVGSCDATGKTWTEYTASGFTCDSPAYRIYCVQIPTKQ